MVERTAALAAAEREAARLGELAGQRDLELAKLQVERGGDCLSNNCTTVTIRNGVVLR